MKQDKEELAAILRKTRQALGRIEGTEESARINLLVGKCFRYRNNYSVPDKPSDYWWLYLKLTKATGSELTGFQFQTDKYGMLTVKPNQRLFRFRIDSGYQEITQAQFTKAWTTVQKRAASWKP